MPSESFYRFFWIENPPDCKDEDKEFVDLRLVPEEVRIELKNQFRVRERIEYVPDPESGKMIRTKIKEGGEDCEKNYADALNDYMICNWFLFDKKHQSIPCTKENKLHLLHGSFQFSSWIKTCLETLQEDFQRDEEDIYNNLVEYAERLNEKPDCSLCKKIQKDMGRELHCDKCLPPLMEENEEAMRMWPIVCGQVLCRGFEGVTIDLDHASVWKDIEKFGIKNQVECFKKLRQLFFYFKDDEDEGGE